MSFVSTFACGRPSWPAAWFVAALLLGGSAAGQEPLRFVHSPSPSPDGRRVAFEWAGDIWLAPLPGGEARRLTADPAWDGNPLFSPDGRTLAFTSERDGNLEVYVMDPGGGSLRRLTYHAGSDAASGFTPDGRAVLFASRRDDPPLGPLRVEYTVPVTGGTPVRLQAAAGSVGALSPDGRRLAFVRGAGSRARRGYRGPAAEDIWIHDLDADTYTQLTDHPGTDTQPVWGPAGEHLYFLSDRGAEGVRNVWRMPAAGGAAEALTAHPHPVDDLAISADGSVLVYTFDDRLWSLRLPTGEPTSVPLTGAADVAEPTELWQTLASGADEFAVAPSGKEVAFVVRGDIYVTRFPDGGPTTQLTDTPAVEGGLAWSGDSRTLWFHSDRAGHNDLYTLTSADDAEPRLRRSATLVLTRRTLGGGDERAPRVSPDGKRLAYLAGPGDIVVADVPEGEAGVRGGTVVSAGWSEPSFAWSPDSRWLAFDREDDDYNVDVFIVPAAGGEAVNVSRHPLPDYAPTWSGDGSKLGFLSQRYNEQADAFFVWLRAEDWEQTAADRADAEDAAYDPPKPARSDDEDEQAEGEGEDDEADDALVIDIEGIDRRLVRLTSTLAGESWLAASPDGEQFAYAADGDLLVMPWDESAKTVASGVSPTAVRWAPDGKSLRFLRAGGRIASVPVGGGSAKLTEFEARVSRELAAEQAYLFDLVWRTLRDEFYDARLHGADWESVRHRYEPRALAAPTRADFERVINEMLGELNSSHQGFYRPESPPAGTPAGDPGIVWAADRDGPGLLVERVVPETPAARQASRIEPGERVLAIDGEAIGPDTNVNALLIGTVGRRTDLTVEAADGAERTVTLRPTTAQAVKDAQYRAWVDQQRARTAELSGGRVGYIHIESMDAASFADFQRDLFAAAEGRDALILDVRWNSGGWTADYLLASLTARPHAYTVPRGGRRGYPSTRLPLPIWTRPVVLLTNEHSVSNAEILAHAFQTLDLGPVVGEPTYGGVISTGRRRLVDGSVLAIPLRGWYRLGDAVNLENNPAEPDVRVPYGPADEAAGRDPQLAAGVAAALNRIGASGLRP